jgi:cytochrome c
LRFTAACGALATMLAVELTGVAVVHAGDNPARGRILFLRCASCHDVGAAPSAKIGPNLRGIVGRKVASLPGYAYSAALRSQDFEWDAAHLDRWIRNPNEVAPGTMMAFAGIADESDRRAIIEFLQNQAAAASGTGAAPPPTPTPTPNGGAGP